jgi:hypothetical protein
LLPRSLSASAVNFSVRASFALVSHSHITRTSQPSTLSLSLAAASRLTFFSNLSFQKAWFVPGVVASRHPWCLCQKQPCTNMQRRCFGRTKSGRPTREATCSRYLNPSRCKIFLTTSSGVVLSLGTRRMISDRLKGAVISMASSCR